MILSKYVDGSFVHQAPKTNNKPGFYKSLRVVDRQNSAKNNFLSTHAQKFETFLIGRLKFPCYQKQRCVQSML